MSVTMSDLPSGLQKWVGNLPQDCQGKVLVLYSKYKFNEDHIECWEMNDSAISADTMAAFEAFLEKEIAPKATKSPGKIRGSQQALPVVKRAKLDYKSAGIALPASVSAAIGLTRADGEGATPVVPKRLREARGDDDEKSATPEAPKPSLTVTVKSSLNSGVVIADRDPAEPAAPPKVQVLGDASLWTGKHGGAYTWMDESVEDRAADWDARLREAEAGLVEAVKARHPGQELAVGIVGVPSQAEIVLVGRIVCEGLEGRLNERSMLLEGSRASCKGARVQLNVASCPQMAAFPGQLVAVLGRCGTGGMTFHARDFVPGFALTPPPAVAAPECEKQLHAVVLAGPFCQRNGLDYEPLERALAHAAGVAPQVVILLGPFLEASNKGVSTGDIKLPGRGEEIFTAEEAYTEHVLPKLRQGLATLKRASPSTEVMIVPSLEDVMVFHPLPQPPLDACLAGSLDPERSNSLKDLDAMKRMGIRFLPNPAHLRINDLTVSVTSADALTPILRSGLVLRPEEKKIEQALRLMLQQRNMFPVAPRDPPQVAEARAAALEFPEGGVPDVCILPSASGGASGTFVDGRLFVNPGSLCRPAAMGSFAELWLAKPPTEGFTRLTDRARVDIKTFSS